ncbi:MAG: AAA family ATPase [Nitrospinae bacterium]|nr:AAA family ATPase [Nitrospinota bacterium]
MYTKFFWIKEKPFNLTPDPKYLYLGKSHQESYAQLFYSVKENVGFVVLTGEVGTGKTTICRSFINQLGDDYRVAYIFNPNHNDVQLLQSLNKELGIPYESTEKKGLEDALYAHLLEQKSAGKRTILLIDEAQNLSPEVLEQIRLLSNLETETQKLMQIILVGQPELDFMLGSQSLRQLRQRVSVWCRLFPLNYDETAQYIKHRMEMAGGAHLDIFTPKVLKEIYKFSKGIPRLINLVCDRALLAAYSKGVRTLDVKTVKECIRDVTGAPPSRNLLGGVTGRVVAIGGLALILIAVSAWFFDGRRSTVVVAPPPMAKLEVAPVKIAPPAPQKPADAIYSPSARNVAANILLAKWGVEGIAEKDEAASTMEQIAEKRNLKCFDGRIDKVLLEKLAYPAIMLLNGEDGKKGYLPVVGFTKDGLSTGISGLEIESEWAFKNWTGDVLIFWRDFADAPDELRKGAFGDDVAKLQTNLKKLGYFTIGVNGTFGAKTERAIKRFQQENGLNPDGMAGETTRMMILGKLQDVKIPRISTL